MRNSGIINYQEQSVSWKLGGYKYCIRNKVAGGWKALCGSRSLGTKH